MSDMNEKMAKVMGWKWTTNNDVCDKGWEHPDRLNGYAWFKDKDVVSTKNEWLPDQSLTQTLEVLEKWCLLMNVTHWMPLPESPKEK